MLPWYLTFKGGKCDTSFEFFGVFFKRFREIWGALDLKIYNGQLSRHHRNGWGEKWI